MKDLSVVSQNVQQIYRQYLSNKLIVNRRYQRKLVWTLDEKVAFIDSIMKAYPVPLILLAESQNDISSYFEIIDGLQRLNAIISFIENDFPINGYFFDLETMAETKLLKDSGVINQKQPILDRKKCTDFTGYDLPVSTYRSANSTEIDEVFRRINANGRHLSRQEIRQAGALYPFADLVRKIACEIRGDASLTDIIELSKMPTISITSRELNYGIKVDDVFWVKNAIINREQVRESKDEEIIADIIATMLFDEVPASNSAILDEYYYLKDATKRASELENKLNFLTPEKVKDNFFVVFDQLKAVLNEADISFNALISSGKNFDKVPRYFEIIYLSLYKIIVKQNKKLTNINLLVDLLNGISSTIKLSKGGGNWSAKERENSISAVIGMIDKLFVENPDDPATVLWSTQLETILQQSKTEQTCFDFKISLYNLQTRQFNDELFRKVVKTLTAMANKGRNSVGYVIIGVADQKQDADKIAQIDSKYSPIIYRDHYITGVNYDIDSFGQSEDKYFRLLTDKIASMPIENNYKNEILNNIKFLCYGTKTVIMLKITGLDKPAIFDNEYYQRSGANIAKIEPKDFISLMYRFEK